MFLSLQTCIAMFPEMHNVLKHNLFIDIVLSHLLFSKIDSGRLVIFRERTLEVNLQQYRVNKVSFGYSMSYKRHYLKEKSKR